MPAESPCMDGDSAPPSIALHKRPGIASGATASAGPDPSPGKLHCAPVRQSGCHARSIHSGTAVVQLQHYLLSSSATRGDHQRLNGFPAGLNANGNDKTQKAEAPIMKTTQLTPPSRQCRTPAGRLLRSVFRMSRLRPDIRRSTLLSGSQQAGFASSINR